MIKNNIKSTQLPVDRPEEINNALKIAQLTEYITSPISSDRDVILPS